MGERLLVFCTCPDRESANSIAAELIERRLAACVNILPEVTSVFRWQGRVTHDSETLLLIKTAGARYAQLETALRYLHPYELPEIIAVDVTRGLPEYLHWLDAETRETP